MVNVKPVRRVVGFISLVSTLVWITLSILVVLITFRMFEPLEKDILAQLNQALNLFQDVQMQTESFPGFLPMDNTEKNTQQAKGLTTLFFNALSGLLGILKLFPFSSRSWLFFSNYAGCFGAASLTGYGLRKCYRHQIGNQFSEIYYNRTIP